MKILEQIERINFLDKLISNRNTGTPEQLAKRLHISVSRLYQIIDELKLYDVPIAYCRNLRSYYYLYEYEMHFSVLLRPLNRKEAKTVNGGYCNGLGSTKNLTADWQSAC